jgi:hypothetical protein
VHGSAGQAGGLVGTGALTAPSSGNSIYLGGAFSSFFTAADGGVQTVP